MPKLGRFLSGQIVTDTELQNKQDFPTVFSPCFSYNPHYGFFCQAKSKAPKAEQVFPHATCNHHSFVLFFCGLIHYEADVTVWKSSIVGVDA